ncbi:hypothetical protein XENOCAPTIV_028006, partial [Xenoophorus captivus]
LEAEKTEGQSQHSVTFPSEMEERKQKVTLVQSASAHLYGTVEMPGEAILYEQSGEVEHCQKQSFELSIVWTVTHEQP